MVSHRIMKKTISNINKSQQFPIEEIKQALIKSCIHNQPIQFIPYLLSKNVTVESPNKIRFYRYFKYLLNCAQCSSEGALTLKMEKYAWEEDKEISYYNFYDEVHKYSRLSIKYKEVNNHIFLDTRPF